MRAIFFSMSFLFLIMGSVHAGSAKSSGTMKSSHDQKQVEVMLLMDKIYDINLSTSTYNVEAEIILSWNDPKLADIVKRDYGETTITKDKLKDFFNKNWHPEFVVSNELSPRTTDFQTLKVYDDGTLEIFEKFITKIAIDADIHEYPFGTLDLVLDISAFTHEAHEMHLEPVYFELGHGYKNEEVIKGPWTLSKKYFEVKDDHRLSTHEAIFSHNKFHFVLKHDFIDSLQKIILPIGAVILFSSFINFFASLKFGPNADWRIGGQLTLILTIFALKFSIADQIPVTHYLNFIDELFLIAIIVVGLNLLSGVFINNMYQQKPDGAAATVEVTIRILQPIITFALLGWAIYSTFYGWEGAAAGH